MAASRRPETPTPGLPVPPELQRSAHRDRDEWVASGAFAVDLMCRTLNRDDLAGVDVLDVGCGTKIVKTLLDHASPLGRYLGIDVNAQVIEWLDAKVDDARFEFHHFDARNDLYNPTGTPLADFEQLPVGEARFDLICLFSVFTHLAPDDYVAMLRLLGPCVAPDGHLLFSLFLNDPEHRSPLARALEVALNSDDPAVVARAETAIAEAYAAKVGGFLDEFPDTPLLQARYDKAYALELIEGTGWDVVSVNPPERHIQHYIVCRPAR